MKTVAILTHHHDVSVRIVKEARTLADVGYNVTLLVWMREHDGRTTKEEQFSVREISLPARGKVARLFWHIPKLYKKLFKELADVQPNILHVTHLALLPPALAFAKVRDLPVFYDAYERYAIDISEGIPYGKKFFRNVLERIENTMVSYVDAVLTTGSAGRILEDRYQECGVPVVELFNVPDLTINSDRNKVKELRNNLDENCVLVYAGGLSVQKGLLKYFWLIRKLVDLGYDVRLWLIGLYHESEWSFLSKCIKRASLRQHVDVIPWLPYKELLSHLEAANISLSLLQPTDSFKAAGKGTSRKLFTYMQCSLPIIATNLSSVSDVVRETSCGLLVDPEDDYGLLKAVRSLIDDPCMAKKLGENGRRAVIEKYNWEFEREKLLSIYKKISLCQN